MHIDLVVRHSLLSLEHYRDIPHIPYELMIIIEPAMVSREVFEENIEDRTMQLKFLFKATNAIRGQWSSRAAAYEWLSKRIPWKSWDDRIRHIYVVRYTLCETCGNAPCVILTRVSSG